jgi:signal transduction histidine kinase
VDEVLDDVRQTWHGALAAANRPLRFVVDDDGMSSTASRAATRQILDVLVGNALRHGSGAVTVRARESAGALALDVLDEGAPTDRLLAAVAGRPQPGHLDSGLGLRLARSLAEAEEGRLLIGSEDPPTRVTLLVPARTP